MDHRGQVLRAIWAHEVPAALEQLNHFFLLWSVSIAQCYGVGHLRTLQNDDRNTHLQALCNVLVALRVVANQNRNDLARRLGFLAAAALRNTCRQFILDVSLLAPLVLLFGPGLLGGSCL